MAPSLDHPPPSAKAPKSRRAPALVHRYLKAGSVVFRAERRAAPKPAPLAMCERLNAESIAVPTGDRPGLPAFSAARLGEGQPVSPLAQGFL